MEAVTKKKTIARALTTASDDRTPLQQGLCGLERFLFFCTDFDGFLNEIHGDSALSTAVFQLYEYWFSVLKEEMIDLVSNALETIDTPDQASLERLPEFSSMMSLFSKASDHRL
ncbi:hypothetical protein IHQ71_01285 [Rhizobium sp. TH2]|uniref:hypothetical protein n=1 Tax=Rhizobium sp. TH2 TaxID=2775403 RepID=UPI0021585036|nr:hypothetical protein [Rhizobium sp. TH2]UVC09293.1 hypothetical protein IHQ71_01285 [Rhizobium sp. TH2]